MKKLLSALAVFFSITLHAQSIDKKGWQDSTYHVSTNTELLSQQNGSLKVFTSSYFMGKAIYRAIHMDTLYFVSFLFYSGKSISMDQNNLVLVHFADGSVGRYHHKGNHKETTPKGFAYAILKVVKADRLFYARISSVKIQTTDGYSAYEVDKKQSDMIIKELKLLSAGL